MSCRHRLVLPRRLRRPGVRIAAALAVTGTLLAAGPSGASGALAGSPPLGQLAAQPAALLAAQPAEPLSAPAALGRRPAARTAQSPQTALMTADLLVSGALPAIMIGAIRRLPGVSGVEPAGVGAGHIDHRSATLMAVDPTTFRVWTPARTARSDPLWRDIAGGGAAVSFDLGQQAGLPLGGVVPITGRSTRPVRIDAFATVGISGVDVIVSSTQGRLLGLPAANALVVSAPRADPFALRALIAGIVGRRAQVELLRQPVVIREAGEFLTNAQIDTVIRAAWSRLGRPYVWGATGPGAFDCSGLVGWAYARVGISLPRTSEEQWYAGAHVPLADARPGDLMFWTYDPTDPANVDHVALYVGHGMMVVAPHTGDDVSYQPVPSAHLAGVVRVDPAMASSVGGPRFTIGSR